MTITHVLPVQQRKTKLNICNLSLLMIKSVSVAIQMKVTEPYFPVVLFIYYTVLGGSTF